MPRKGKTIRLKNKKTGKLLNLRKRVRNTIPWSQRKNQPKRTLAKTKKWRA